MRTLLLICLFALACGTPRLALAVSKTPNLSCQSLLGTQYEVLVGEEEFLGSESTFLYQDLQYGFVFEAHLVSDGFLLIDAFLIDEERGIRSQQKGRYLFKRMIEHFGVDKVTGIRARWSGGTNFDAYHEALRAGLPPEKAAFETWTGRLAVEYGFSEVASISKAVSPLELTTHIVEFVRNSQQESEE